MGGGDLQVPKGVCRRVTRDVANILDIFHSLYTTWFLIPLCVVVLQRFGPRQVDSLQTLNTGEGILQ